MVTTIVITEADIGEAPPSLQKGADNLLPPTLLIGGGKAPPPHLFFFFLEQGRVLHYFTLFLPHFEHPWI